MAEHQTVAFFIKMAQVAVLVAVALEMELALLVEQEIAPLHLHRKVALAVTEFKRHLHTQQGVVVAHLPWAETVNQIRAVTVVLAQPLQLLARL